MLMEFSGATLDSRAVKPGMLFVAVKGEKVDGRDFIPDAMARGAAGVVEGRDNLANAAREYRRTLDASVVGVTGSAGKTTVKELTAAFLSTLGRTHATSGNFNNDLGLPLTILNCPRDARFLVVEMGTNHPGEIANLASIAEPEVGLVSSIGTAHIEFFGTQEGIAREKGALLAALAPRRKGAKSFAVLARDNPQFAVMSAMSAAPVVEVAADAPEASAFAEALRDRLPGAHNVSNALIAYACAREFGATLDACLAALADFKLPGDRWRKIDENGVFFISDCYNANPTSMMASLETFAAQPCKGRRIAVLGEMYELGPRGAELHAQVKAKAESLGLDRVVYVGAGFGGVTVEEAGRILGDFAKPGDVVFLKASHGLHLERLLPDGADAAGDRRR